MFACYFFLINGLNCVGPLKYKMAKKILSFKGTVLSPPTQFWIFLLAQSYYVTMLTIVKDVRPRGEVVLT